MNIQIRKIRGSRHSYEIFIQETGQVLGYSQGSLSKALRDAKNKTYKSFLMGNPGHHLKTLNDKT